MQNNKYPKSVQKVIKEAPLAYALVILVDYKEKRKTAKQILVEWNKDKLDLIKNL